MPREMFLRLALLASFASLILAPINPSSNALAQTEPDSPLRNPGFEDSDAAGNLVGWGFPSFLTDKGYTVSAVRDLSYAGEVSALVDSTSADTSENSFGNLAQSFDATPWRGKRVRFQAAVRVSEVEEDGRGQLWFRVDRAPEDGQSRIGAFDNMQDRPITDPRWQTYEIVADVDDDAERITLGLLVLGKAKVWIDEAKFEIVDADEATTTMDVGSPVRSQSPQLEDQGQAFWTPWLLLAIVTIAFLGVSQIPISKSFIGYAQRFTVRFSIVYWVFYSFPTPFTSLIPKYGYQWAAYYESKIDLLVRWTAENALDIEQALVAPNGSGDTTYAYIRLLLGFAIALVVALIWTCADWRRTDHRLANDLLRSYLRYVLAATMLGYGLAKVGFAMNQFPAPGVDSLMRSYGDSSPMGLVWTFMGASRAYTIFAGLGEVVGALLIVWRRTSTLGALVIIGVMTNVVMLNFCYDVPVKQYSAHLLLMAIVVVLPDAPRLLAILIRNRKTEPIDLTPPYTNRVTIWFQRAAKAIVLTMLLGVPIEQKIVAELNYEPYSSGQPDYFGSYEVEEFIRDGETVPPLLTDATRWRYVTLQRAPRFQNGTMTVVDYLSVRAMNDGRLMSEIDASNANQILTVSSSLGPIPNQLQVTRIDEDHLLMTDPSNDEAFQVRLRRIKREDFLLVNRGFRWINEYPFNR